MADYHERIQLLSEEYKRSVLYTLEHCCLVGLGLFGLVNESNTKAVVVFFDS